MPKGRYTKPWVCPKCGTVLKHAGGHPNSCGQWDRWFAARVDKRGPDECWLWIGQKDKNGYGRSARKGPNVYPHRVAWRLANGDIPADMEVAHRCDVRNCCNPAHLFLATHEENMKDCMTKNRHVFGAASHHAKLTTEQVIEIRAKFKKYSRRKSNIRELAAQYPQVKENAIYLAATGRSWKRL